MWKSFGFWKENGDVDGSSTIEVTVGGSMIATNQSYE